MIREEIIGGVYKEAALRRCSYKKVFREYAANLQETPIPKCDLQSNFIEIALRHGCSPVNLLHIFRTPFPKNTPGWLLLSIPNSFGRKVDKEIISMRKFVEKL